MPNVKDNSSPVLGIYILIKRTATSRSFMIKQAGGLYGRISTEAMSRDVTAFGLYTRPRSRFSHGRTDQLSSVKTGFRLKIVLTSLNMAFLPIFRSRFKQSLIPALKTLTNVLRFCVCFLGDVWAF